MPTKKGYMSQQVRVISLNATDAFKKKKKKSIVLA